MSSDAEMLRRYVEERSEAAFAELVKRHLNLVYFSALRQVGGDAHAAQDITQTVFTDLARKASTLTGRSTLTGWLHTSTRFAASKARRSDFSRQKRDQEAQLMHTLLHDDSASAADWERLRPMIDEALHELGDRDREAVLLRFFEGRTFADVGATLQLSEDAARMRVERALEKLRTTLARRGVASTTSALALAFANQVAANAPASLQAMVTSTALAGAATSGVAVGTATFFGAAKFSATIAVAALVGGAALFALRKGLAEQNPSGTAQSTVAPEQPVRSTSQEPAKPEVVAASVPSSGTPVKTEWKSAAELMRAGKATPRAALETLMLALVESDVDAFLSTLSLGQKMREKFELQLRSLPKEGREKHGPAEKLYALNAVEKSAAFIPRVAAIRIVGETVDTPDQVTLKVQLQEVSGGIHEQPIEFYRAADGWRWRPPEK